MKTSKKILKVTNRSLLMMIVKDKQNNNLLNIVYYCFFDQKMQLDQIPILTL